MKILTFTGKTPSEALKKAKKVVSMMGSFDIGNGEGKIIPEWNVVGNREAASKYLSSGANITLTPLNVTDHFFISNEHRTAIFNRQTPLTNALGALYALWYRHASWAVYPKMHDGVAIGMVLWPELFKTEEVFAYIDDEGYTRIDDSKPPNCTIGVQIDSDSFIDRLYRRIITQNYER